MVEIGKIRVLCAHDHTLIRDGIAFALQTQTDMELVGEAVNGEETIRQYRSLRPDIVLVGMHLPDMNGVDAIACLRKEFPRSRFIAITHEDEDVLAARALKAGASSCLLKHMLRAEMIETIREVYRGFKLIPPAIASNLMEYLGAEDLSRREIEILQLVAAGNSNKVIAGELSISENTVKGHMKNIMVKLNANDRTHAVLIALNRGFFERKLSFAY